MSLPNVPDQGARRRCLGDMIRVQGACLEAGLQETAQMLQAAIVISKAECAEQFAFEEETALVEEQRIQQAKDAAAARIAADEEWTRWCRKTMKKKTKKMKKTKKTKKTHSPTRRSR